MQKNEDFNIQQYDINLIILLFTIYQYLYKRFRNKDLILCNILLVQVISFAKSKISDMNRLLMFIIDGFITKPTP